MTDVPSKTGREALGLMIDKLTQIVYSKPSVAGGASTDTPPTDVVTDPAKENIIDSVNATTEPPPPPPPPPQTNNVVHVTNVGNRLTGDVSKSNVLISGNAKIQNAGAHDKATVVPVLIVPKVSATESMKPLTDSNDGTHYQCTMCEYKSYNKHYLKQHVDLVHVSNRPFKCPFCDYAGKRSQALKEHLVVHSNESPYSCDVCSASFRKKGHLTSHVRLHGSTRMFECNICHKDFVKRKLLYMHLREFHPSQNVYACDMCEYTTTIKSNIIMHMHTHSNPKTYQCSQCDFKAIHINLLTQHMKQHRVSSAGTSNDTQSQVIMLKCTECGFSTESEDVLRDHMWSHLDNVDKCTAESAEKRTPPPSCQKPTTQPQNTESIVGSLPQLPVMYKADGSSVTVYKCSECSFTSQEAYQFITHMLSHKPRFPKPVNQPLNSENTSFTFDPEQQVFRCLICGYACEHQRTIKSHIWKHSGHTKIEYPMFQNGPISLYDSDDDDDLLPVSESTKLSHVHKSPGDFQKAGMSGFASSPPQAQILLNPHKPAFLPGRILKTPSQSSISSLGSSVGKRSSEDPEFFSTKFCKVDGRNVIVETLNDIYTTPKFLFSQSNHSSPRARDSPAPPSEVAMETNTTPPGGAKQSEGSPSIGQPGVEAEVPSTSAHPVHNAKPTNEQTNFFPQNTTGDTTAKAVTSSVGGDMSASQEEAVTLLSLLKKGPNFNPACPTVIPGAPKLELPRKRKRAGTVEAKETPKNMSEAAETPPKAESVASDGSKSKSGICSSLLAVIEQLRERSTSESEPDDRKSACAPPSKRKAQESPDSDDSWLADYPNVEKVTGNDDDVFRCKLCHYSNISCALMKQHMVVHKSKLPFECSLCDFMASSSEDLQDHMIQHCKARTYQCKMCQANFTYKSQLRAHIRITHASAPSNLDGDAFMCDDCNFVAPSLAELKIHMDNHASKSEGSDTKSESGSIGKRAKEKTLQCEHCDYVCVSSSRMRQHQSIHEDGPIKCEQCDFTAISSRSLKSHMKRHINDQRYVQQPLEQYKCGLCGYVCHHLPSLKSHMWRHAGDNNYQYEVTNNAINAAIDYELGRGSDSNAESGKDEEEKKSLVRFRCCQCGFETVDKTALQDHMLVHVTSTTTDQPIQSS